MRRISILVTAMIIIGAMCAMAEFECEVTGGIPPYAELPDDVTELVEKGEYTSAQKTMKTMIEKEYESMPMDLRLRMMYEIERLDRVRDDFVLSKDELLTSLKEEIKDVTMDDIDRWEKMGFFDYRIIDGKKLYFSRSRSNLYKLCKEARERGETTGREEGESRRAQQMREIKAAALKQGDQYVMPRRIGVHMTITVPPNKVPHGEIIRCWMPFPRKNPLHDNIKIFKTMPEQHHLAPPDQLQRSIYFEQPAVKDQPTSFSVEYEFTSYASYVDVDPAKVTPYDKTSDVYRTYTAERSPHLKFSDSLRQIAEQVVGDETNPYLKAKKIYGWVTENIRYTYAIEYSTIPSISQYCLDNMRGDCGIQALLFTVLCRISGVPARWQSGWTLSNMHDWAQFYVEPYGWLWADPSMCIMDKEDPEIRWFLFGNIDNTRLVANNDYGMEFDPPKWHFRSEPIDFQRGEVEWRCGNLYFGEWSYSMKRRTIE